MAPFLNINYKLKDDLKKNFIKRGKISRDNNTLFENIRKIPSGCYLSYSIDNFNHFSIKRWFKFQENSLKHFELRTKPIEIIAESIKKQIPKESEFGILLSGGIDSTAVAAVVSNSTYNLHTYTGSF